jgi:hypothetical protein
MIDQTDETYRPLSRALNMALPDRRPSAATAWRWYRHGIKGVRLETWLAGGRRVTSVAAIFRFIEATTAVSDGHKDIRSIRSSRRRQQDIERAERELANPRA